jgi:spermidine/putrescine transport system permease protein
MSLTSAEAKNRSTRLGQAFALKRKYLAIPYALFLVLFVIIPLLLIVGYAFTDTTPKRWPKVTYLLFRAIAGFFTNSSKWSVLFVSLFIGIQTTLICLVLGLSGRLFPGREEVQRQ